MRAHPLDIQSATMTHIRAVTWDPFLSPEVLMSPPTLQSRKPSWFA